MRRATCHVSCGPSRRAPCACVCCVPYAVKVRVSSTLLDIQFAFCCPDTGIYVHSLVGAVRCTRGRGLSDAQSVSPTKPHRTISFRLRRGRCGDRGFTLCC